jgi:hypothetical protein
MRAASILLALVVVLAVAREAGAEHVAPLADEIDPAVYLQLIAHRGHDHTINFGGHRFGFCDTRPFFPENCTAYFGPLGTYETPFTATQVLVGFCLMVFTLIASLVVFTVRWKRKRA